VDTRTNAQKQDRICKMLLVKLAMRCNINCTYCYWFRDRTVYEKPAVLTPEAEAALLTRLEQHIATHRLRTFAVVFHGGEPLLFGKQRLDALCSKLRELEQRSGCELRLSLTTNGLLVDAEWANLFVRHGVGVTVSIDGPRRIHDKRRLDFQNRGTFDRVVAALPILQGVGIEPGIIAVCNPGEDPVEVFEFFVNQLGIRKFDILMPDATHDEPAPPSIAPYYKRLFDTWYQHEDVRIRIIENLVGGLLGISSSTHSIGHKPITTVTMLTDGSLEPLEVLRIAGDGATQTRVNIFEHDLHAIQDDPLWREVYEASATLAAECRSCPYRSACGGGHIASRWSAARRYDNPTVYCADIKDILRHIWDRMLPDLYVEAPAGQISMTDAVEPAKGSHAE
jgi:uncharacterized protein